MLDIMVIMLGGGACLPFLFQIFWKELNFYYFFLFLSVSAPKGSRILILSSTKALWKHKWEEAVVV